MRLNCFFVAVVTALTLVGWVAPVPIASAEEKGAAAVAPKLSDDEIRKNLIGSWRIVSASFGGVESELHKNSITIKHVTPVHLIWIGYQPDDRKIFRSAGGSWKVADGKYIETMRYGLADKFKETTFGKEFAFDCRFEGDLWVQSATLPNGSEMIETWQRVKPDEDVAQRPADKKP